MCLNGMVVAVETEVIKGVEDVCLHAPGVGGWQVKLLKYNHPARSKYDVRKTYALEDLRQELSDEDIKAMFVPVNFEWENESEKISVKEEKLVEEEILEEKEVGMFSWEKRKKK